MAHVVLFHHTQGLRKDVIAWADSLREAGHEVTTPDLFEGLTFDRFDDGIAHRDEVGLPELMGRAATALEDLPAELVYARVLDGSVGSPLLLGDTARGTGCAAHVWHRPRRKPRRCGLAERRPGPGAPKGH